MHLTRTLSLALAIGCCTFAASFANAGTMAPDRGTTMHLQNTTDLPGAVKPRVVMLGDSITKGVRPGVKPAETFAARLQLALRADGIAVEIINAGIGGERTDQAISRLTGKRCQLSTVDRSMLSRTEHRGGRKSRVHCPGS